MEWNDKRVKTAQRILESGKYDTVQEALVEIGRVLQEDISRSSLLKSFERFNLKPPSEYLRSPEEEEEDEEEYTDPVERFEAKDRDKRLRSEHADLVDRLRESEARHRFITEIDRPINIPKIKRRETKSGIREGTAVIMASDWHVEENVYAEAVAGRNSYNPKIAEARAERFFTGIEWLLDFGRNEFSLRDVILWLGGDLITGYIHDELEEDNDLSPIEAVLFAKRLITKGIKTLLLDPKIETITIPCSFGNHGRCHDDQTELLTVDGWKKYTQIAVGDIVATYNMDTSQTEWQPLEDVYVAEYQGPMVKVKTTTADFMVTPHHRMVVRSGSAGRDRFLEIQELAKRGTFGANGFPKCSLGHTKEYTKVSDDELRLLGWIMTDGSYATLPNGKRSLRIYQSKKNGIAVLTALLNRLGVKYSAHTRTRKKAVILGKTVKRILPDTTFHIEVDSGRKFIELLPNKRAVSGWMYQLSERQFGCFLEGLLGGDGSVRPPRNVRDEERVIYGDSDVLGSIQTLAVTNGIAARVRQDNRGNHILSLPASRQGFPKKALKTVPYSGVIWCGTVKNGTLITRRNGVPLVSGNTTAKRRIKTGAKNSYEWLLYNVLQQDFADEKRVRFVVDKSAHQYVEAYEFDLHFHHGDEVKFGGGIGGLSVPLNKRVFKWDGVKRADYHHIGHFHQLTDLGRTVVNGCFPAGTLVTIPGGVLPIEDVQVGTPVISRDGTHQTVEAHLERDAESLIDLGIKGFYKSLQCTPNHQIWAMKGSDITCVCTTHGYHKDPVVEAPKWIAAEFLSAGDWVHIPHLTGESTKSIGTDLAWVYGLFLAEGHTTIDGGFDRKHHRLTWTMHIRELPILERVKTILDPIMNNPGVLSVRESRNTSCVTFSCGREVALDWRNSFGHKSIGKKLPNWAYSLPVEERVALVKGWIDGDGHQRITKDGNLYLTATSISQQLAWGMFMLANGTHYEPTVKSLRPGGRRKNTAYSVLFNQGQDVKWVAGEKFVRICHRRMVPGDIKVYDLQVSGEHTFIANGVGVHNSLIGYSEYAMSIGADYEPPQQAMYILDSKRGKCMNTPLWVDEASPLKRK